MLEPFLFPAALTFAKVHAGADTGERSRKFEQLDLISVCLLGLSLLSALFGYCRSRGRRVAVACLFLR
jgi:hypothetical protein